MTGAGSGRTALLFALLGVAVFAAGCSIKRIAANNIANAMTSGADVYATDNDPELVRDALPFGLKTIESLLDVVPQNRNLLLAACRGYTQYAYAFVQLEADNVEASDYAKAVEMRERALKLYLRARGYGIRALELRNKGIGAALSVRPDSAAARIPKQDVDLLFWLAASWGSAISIGKDHPDLMADVNVVRALMDRGLSLDESFDLGSIHEALITLEALPAMMGGSLTRARQHFERAVALSNGRRASPFVTMAESVSIQTQNRAEFDSLLTLALAVDPDRDPPNRLANLVIQRRARLLQKRADELFIDSATPEETKKK